MAVAELCLLAGAAEVIIGDGSHAPVLNWEHAVTLDGSTNLASEAARLTSQYGRPGAGCSHSKSIRLSG